MSGRIWIQTVHSDGIYSWKNFSINLTIDFEKNQMTKSMQNYPVGRVKQTQTGIALNWLVLELLAFLFLC